MPSPPFKDRPRFRLFDVIILIVASALAALWARPFLGASFTGVDWLTFVGQLLGVAAGISFLTMMLHHFVAGDRRHLGWGGSFAFGLPAMVFGTISLAALIPPLRDVTLLFGLWLLGVLVFGALLSLLVLLASPTFRAHLDWLDVYGLITTVLGGLWVYTFIREVGKM